MSSWNEEETDLQDVSIKSKEKLAALDATCMVSSGTLSLLWPFRECPISKREHPRRTIRKHLPVLSV
jgi:hypothetical protein